MKKKIPCISINNVVYQLKLDKSDSPDYKYKLVSLDKSQLKTAYISSDNREIIFIDGIKLESTNFFYCHIYAN